MSARRATPGDELPHALCAVGLACEEVTTAVVTHLGGHASVIAVDNDGRHVLLAADATDTLEQLHARRPDAITSDPDLQVQTIDRILAHAADHPTIYLPTHDPDAVERLEAATTL